VTQLNSQLEHIKKQVRMMTTGTTVLQEILEVKNTEKPEGADFNYKALNKKQHNINSAYALEDCGMVRKQQATAETNDSTRSKSMLEHSKEHLSSRIKKKHDSWVCHHCKGKGHIRPYCSGNLKRNF